LLEHIAKDRRQNWRWHLWILSFWALPSCQKAKENCTGDQYKETYIFTTSWTPPGNLPISPESPGQPISQRDRIIDHWLDFGGDLLLNRTTDHWLNSRE
jgi:hypothetical protein